MAGRQLPKDPVQSAALVEKIGEHSQRMMEAMDDIVWSINPVNDSMVKVVARMREFAGELLEAQGIQLTFRADEAVHDVKLGVEARRDFFLIFKEAVNNLAKYARAGQALVEVGLQGNRLRLSVQDDGMGFNVENPETEGGGNGLANMRKRAQQLHGDLEIRSQKGRGTTIRLEIPV
jgi:signal transduction histidine kinase